jgi:ubiquinone/menaquinone biosynthesis C-methylase UbiE
VNSAAARPRSVTDVAIADAYSAAGTSWCDGPGLVYERLAALLVARSPVSLRGAAVIDIGAGTGAASVAALSAGARSVLAVDVAAGMLAVDAARRPPSVVADATALPVSPASFDVALAAFSFNHLGDPVAGFLEAARVVKPGGAVMASAYAADDHHPVKGAVEQALGNQGWTPTAWQNEMYGDRAPRLATAEACAEVIAASGLDATSANVHVGFGDLAPRDWVLWRLGMAHYALFVRTLTGHQREQVKRDALRALGDDPPALVRSIMVVTVRC